MRRKLLILFIAMILMMTVGVSAYSHQVKILPLDMTEGCQGYFDGMLDDGVVIVDPFNQGSLELVYDFEEQTNLTAIKLFIAEKKNLTLLISYDLGDGYWRNTAEVGEFSQESLNEGWNRIELEWNDVERVKLSLSGTSIQTDTGISEIEFWGVNSQETVEIFSADVLGEIEFGKSSGTVQEHIYQIQINRSLLDLEKAELLYQSYDVEGEEGKFSINDSREYYLTVSTPHLRHQWENIQRLVYPGFIQEGENTLEIKLGDQKKNGFSLKDVGLKLYFDRGEIYVVDWEIYEDGQAIDSADILLTNILDGDRETYWESGAISPTEVVIYMNFGEYVWLEAIDIDFELVFSGEVSLEYLRDGIWNSITGWNRRLLNELENGLNEISLGEEGIITEQIRLVLLNTVHQPVVGRVCDVKVWGSKYWSDSERPEVVITYPEDKMFVGNHTVLQGYVLNPYTSLTLNDEVLQSEEGVFEEELNLAPERGHGGSSNQNGSESPHHGIGDVILEVKALNASGEEGVDQIQVYMDTPPEVEILSPMDGIYTNVGQVLVEGTVDKDSYDLTINGEPISYYDKTFSFNYNLQPWLNLIKVKAVNLKELVGEAEVRVIYDQNAPLLYFDQDYDGQILGVDSILISGQVYDYSPVVLKINEQEISVIQGYFSETFDLSLEGENNCMVEVVDAAGNVLEQEFEIIRDLTPPNQFTPIVDPADWSQVIQPVISFNTIDDYAGVNHYELRVENEEWRVVESPYTLSELEDGVHLVEVKAVDNLGWSRVCSVNVYVDTTVPESFQPVAEPASWTQNVQPIISFETTDVHSGIDHYELRVGNEELRVVESPSTLLELEDGVHTVYVKAIDKVGLSTEEIVKVYIDTTEPEMVGGFKGVAGPAEVILTWDKSIEEDVTHYRMYREPEWSNGVECLSFENTETEFEYVDYDVQIGDTYKYQLIAVDHADNQSEPLEIESPAGIVEEEINPEEGGVVEYANLVLVIPEGAMTETGIIEAKAKPIDEAPESVNKQIGMIISLNLLNPETKEVEEAEFEKDLTLTFTYDENELSSPSDELNLDVYYYDEIREIWIKIPGKEQDLLNNTITVKLNHFTDLSTQVTENYSPSAAEYRDMGLSPFQSYFENNNEYVNPASGSLTVKTTDLVIPGRGLDLVIGRIYSSLDAVNKALQKKTPKYSGYYAFNSGWTLNIPWIGSDDNGLNFHTEDGAAYGVTFNKKKSDYYHNDKYGYHFLSNKEDGNINIILSSGIKYVFDEDTGYIKRKEDLNGNEIVYDIKDGKINEIEDTIDRKVRFKYTADNMLDYIEYNRLKYDYNYTEEKLNSFVDPMSRVTEYGYVTKVLELNKEIKYDTYEYILPESEDEEGEWVKVDRRIVNDDESDEVNLLSAIVYPTGGVSTYTFSRRGYTFKSARWLKNEDIFEMKRKIEEYDIKQKIVVSSQKQYLNTIDKENDENIIKQKTYKYTFYDSSSVISNTTMEIPEQIKTQFYFDERNSLTQTKKVYDMTRENKDKAIEKIEYKYTSDKEIEEESLARDGDHKYTKKYQYDDWGNVTYEENTANNAVVHYRYLNTSSKDLTLEGYITPPSGGSTVENRYDLVIDMLMFNKNPETQSITHIQKHYKYDSKGNLNNQYEYLSFNGEWYHTNYQYDDGHGNVTVITDAEGNVTEMDYADALNGAYLTSVIKEVTRVKLSEADPEVTDTITTHFGYDKETGNMIWELNGNGSLTTYEYDDINRLIEIVYSDDTDESFDPASYYDTMPDFPWRNDNPSKVQIYEDEANEDHLFVTTVANLRRPVDFDHEGILIKQIKDDLLPSDNTENPTFNRTKYYYDSLNRLKEIHQYLRPEELLPEQTNPVKTIFEYDSAGNQNIVIDAEENKTEKIFDGLGRIKRIIYPEIETYDGKQPSVTINYYDALNKREIVDANGMITTEEKDWNGNVTKVSKTNGGVIYSVVKVFDQLNQVVKEIDQAGQETKYYYDSFGWVRKVELSEDEFVIDDGSERSGTGVIIVTPTILYDYDRLGNKISEITPMGCAKYGSSAISYLNQNEPYVNNYEYNELGQLVKSVAGGKRKAWHFYDKNGNGIKTVTSGGQIIRKEYMVNNLVKAEMVVNGLEEISLNADGTIELPLDWDDSEKFDQSLSLVTYKEYDIIGKEKLVVSAKGVIPEEEVEEEVEVGEKNSNIVKEVNLFGKEWHIDGDYVGEFSYDAMGRKSTDKRTIVDDESKEEIVYRSQYHYDLVGNLIRTITPTNQVVEYQYNDLYWLETAIQYNELFDSITNWSFEDDLTTTIDPKTALVNRHIYDAVGNKRVEKSPSGKATTFFYDEMYRLRRVRDAKGNEVRFGYDAFGNKTSEIDGTYKETKYLYNSQNQLEQVTEANGAITNYYYDLNGNLTAKVMDDGYLTTYWYNQLGELSSEKRGTDNLITYGYDVSGNPVLMIDRKDQEIKTFYNKLGLPVRVEFYDSEGKLEDTNKYSYDREGNRIGAKNTISAIDMTINPLGQVNEEMRIIREIVDRTIEEKSYPISYSYDMAGNMTEIEYPNASIPVTYRYNNYSQLIGIDDFADGTVEDPAFEYNPDGFIEKIRYNNKTMTMITPDEVNRVEKITVIGPSQTDYYKDIVKDSMLLNIGYDYDGANNVKKRTNYLTGYENNYGYDEVHRLTSATVEGNFIQERLSDNRVAEGDFDVNKSLVKIEDELYEVDFDYNGNSVGVQFAIPVPVVKVEVKHFDDLITPLVHRISKDALSVHTSLDNINFKTLDRSKWEFSLDGFGNIVITFDEPIETRYLKIHSQFEDRDENDEIINLSQFKNLLKDMVHVYQMSEEGILEYDYDSVGNRTEKKRFLDSGTDEIKYYYDSGNGKGNGRRLLYETAIGVDGVERNLYGYRYDENGNLVEKSNRFMVKATGDVELIISAVGVEYWKYAYDVQNRLVKIEKNREVIAEYGYDVDGMRVLSKINDKRTRYIYNFVGNVVYEEDDEKARSYIYGHGKIIAEVKGTVGSSGEVYYYHHDNLGSTRLITDSDGQVMMDQDYLPFGDDLNRPGMLESVSSYETGYKYTGQHQEVEIGLYYYGARFYDQRVGRFVSEDSYLGRLDNSLSQHLYIYVLQNPMKYVDPTGNYATVDIDGPTKDLGNGITSHLSDDDIKMLNKEFEEIYGFFERRSMIKEFKKLKVSNKTHIENEVKIMKDLFVKGIISWRAYFVVMKNLVGDDFDKCILSLEQNIAMSNKILYNGMTEEEIWDQYNFMYFDPPTSSSGVDWEVVGNGLVTFFSGGGQLVTGIGLIATPDVTVTKVVGAYTIIHGGSNMAQGFKTIINGFEGKGIAPNYLQESYIWLSSKAFEKTLGKGSEGIGRAAGALLFRSVDIAICVYGTQDAIKTLSKSKQLENGAFFVRNTKFKIFEKLSFFPSYYPAQFQLTTSRIGAINDIHSYFSGGISLYEEINSFQMYSQKED